MAEFTLSLAGITVKAECIYDTTGEYCRDFLCDGEAEVRVEVTQADIDREQEKSARADALEGRGKRIAYEPYLETLALYRKITDAFVEKDIMLFHGSAIEVDGQAYIFTAKSGTGKTTHTRLWQQLLGEKMSIVNGDKPLLKFASDGIYVCGTPWRGKEGYGSDSIVPVKAVCIIERAEKNSIRRISFAEAFPTLLQQTNRPEEAALVKRTLEMLNRLGAEVGLYRLGCNMDIEAARVAYEGMK